MRKLILHLARCMACYAVVTLAACGGDDIAPRVAQAGGTVNGLAGSGLVLQNNGREDLPVSANGRFAFAPALQGTPYRVTLKSQPHAPSQICTVSNGSGTLGDDMAAIAVDCVTPAAPAYVIGGTITGLTSAAVWLQDNGGDDLPVAANGTFAFPTPLLNGAHYAVTIKTQPDAALQTCTVSNGAGTVNAANVTGVNINCVTQVAHTVGGTVTGLLSTLVLNDGVDLPVSGNGRFTFPNTFLEGAAYSVSIKTYPGTPVQSCTISNGTGTVGASDVTDVTVNCDAPVPVPTYAIGGTVNGLQGTGLILKDGRSGRTLNVAANGSFTFGPRLVSGTAYALAVQAQPAGPAQSCTVSNGSGTVGTADVATIAVTCAPPPHFAFVTSVGATTVFSVDNTTGALTATGSSVPVGGILPGSIASNRFLYLADVAGNSVHGYAIDSLSGALAEVAGSPFATGATHPQAMGVAPGGKFLYAANRDSNNITVFAIDAATGALTPVGLPVATGASPMSVNVTPNGKYLYVANRDAHTVSSYAIDAGSGALTFIGNALTTSIRFMAIDANSKFIYMTTGADSSLSAYAINSADGTLAAVPGMPFTAGNGAQNIAIDPLGKFLYVSNETDATVSGFTIDAATGVLAMAGLPLPTGGNYPEGVAVDPNGKFVYAAAQGTGNVAVFKVDPATGSLAASGAWASPGGLPFAIVVLNPQ